MGGTGMKNPINTIKRKASNYRTIRETFSTHGLEKKMILDYLYCKRKFKCNVDEYLQYKFYNYKDRYRKQFLLGKHRNMFLNINIGPFTLSKYVFYQFLSNLYKRELILAPNCGEDTFVQFLQKHKKVILKPDMGSLGKDVRLFEYTDEAAAREYFRSIGTYDYTVCEELIIQHPVLNQLNPYSVNTIRISTLLLDGEVEILAATLRCGSRADSIVDNLSSGGIGVPVDVDTGILCTYGKDFEQKAHSHHPTSGVQIIGLQIPHWDQAVALVKQAHKQVPHCSLYGWDIAITENGVDIVEANSKPGIKNMQLLDGVPRGQKILPLLESDPLKDKRDEYYNDWKNRFLEHIDPVCLKKPVKGNKTYLTSTIINKGSKECTTDADDSF